MRSFVVALLVAVCVFADADFTFSGNMTVQDLEEFKFRETTLKIVTGKIQGISSKGLLWSSSSVNESVFKTNSDIDAAGAFHMVGIEAGGYSIPTMTFGTFVPGLSEIDSDVFYLSFSGNPSVENTTGLIGFLMPGLIEVDPDGTVVGTLPFSRAWTEYTEVNTTLDGVTIFTASASQCEDADITEYIIASDVPGYLKYGKTPVSPNTLEVVLEINDYKYASSKDHLELVFISVAVLDGGKGEVRDDIVFNNITDDLTTYVALRDEAIIGKKSAKVQITSIEESKVPSKFQVGPAVQMVVGGAFSLRGPVHYDYKIIAFPPGAKHIVYDPVFGAGQNVYETKTGSASSVVLSIVAVLLAVFLLF